MDSLRTPKSLSAELRELIDKRNMLTTRTRMKVLSALDEIQQQNDDKKEESLRAQTIQEILSSEVKYMKQLEIIMEFFMKPMQERKLLDRLSYTTLFENIETVYNVNGELLKELKRNPENVAQAFLKLAPFFKLYSVYAYNYKRALVVLQDIQQNYSAVSEFILNQETRPEVNTKLPSLLIAPIQRIPRYKLLLQEVLRHTAPRRQDYNFLQASLVEIEKVAIHINSLVAEYEDTQKLLELQKHIVGSINLVKPGRKLIHQGPLMRVSRRGNSSFQRHFVLLSDTLLYCKGDPENSLTVCCILPLNKCRIERVLSNKLFKVVCMQETLLLYSENGDSEAWIETLQEAVKKYMECRKTLRKDSSSRVPMRRIIRFDNDNIIERRCKRKRPMSTTEEIDEVNNQLVAISKDFDFSTSNCFQGNNSNIIYVNRDTESDMAAESSNVFLALKRFKRESTECETTVERIKFWMDSSKRKSTHIEMTDKNNFFHQTKNTKLSSEILQQKFQQNLASFSKLKDCEEARHDNTNQEYCIENLNESQKDERSLSLKNVGKFFTTITNTVKRFFTRTSNTL